MAKKATTPKSQLEKDREEYDRLAYKSGSFEDYRRLLIHERKLKAWAKRNGYKSLEGIITGDDGMPVGSFTEDD